MLDSKIELNVIPHRLSLFDAHDCFKLNIELHSNVLQDVR